MTYGTRAVSPRPRAAPGAAEGRTGGLKVGPSRQPATGLTLDLPLPPSVNDFQHVWQGSRLVPLGNRSKCVKEFWKAADAYIFEQKQWIKLKAIKGLFAINIVWTKTEAGNSDIDNRVKPLLDYLQRIAVIDNDKDCRLMSVSYGRTNLDCRVTIVPWTEVEVESVA